MNKVEIRAEEVPPPYWTGSACSFVQSVLKILGKDNWEVSLLLCNNKYIRSLNTEYRNIDEPTDVLSFPLGEQVSGGYYLAGDLVVSLDALKENALFFNVSEDEELRRLLVHGILHLSGYDHATNGNDEPMLIKQEEILLLLTEKIL